MLLIALKRGGTLTSPAKKARIAHAINSVETCFTRFFVYDSKRVLRMLLIALKRFTFMKCGYTRERVLRMLLIALKRPVPLLHEGSNARVLRMLLIALKLITM